MEIQPGYEKLHHLRALGDLIPVARKGLVLQHAFPETSEERLSFFFPSSLKGGSIPLDDQVGRLF